MMESKPKGPWQEVLEPIIAKFNTAWLAKGEAIWNAEGSEALAKLLTDMAAHLDNSDNFFIPREQAEKEIAARDQRIARMMSDHGRMLWEDDVKGHCPTPKICFEYGGTVRCSPCAIKQADAAGVATIDPERVYLPAVARLNRENAAKDEEITRLRQIIATIPENIRKKIREVDDNNSYWGGPSRQAYPDAPEILKEIETILESSEEK